VRWQLTQKFFKKYFDILEACFLQNSIFDKADATFNCDETGLQLNRACWKDVTKSGCKNLGINLQ
jgi:hypothetical protein